MSLEQWRLFRRPGKVQRWVLLSVSLIFLFAAWAGKAANSGFVPFGFVSISNSPNPVVVGSNLTYRISLVNTSTATASGLAVTNTFSGAFRFQQVAGASSNGQTVTLTVGDLPANSTNNLSLVVSPTVPGLFTNLISVGGANLSNVSFSLVTSVVLPNGDLGISLAVPGAVIVGDVTAYSFTMVNSGSSPVSGVVVTNAVPGVVILGVVPTTGVSTAMPGQVVITGVSLTVGGSLTYNVSIQPTNLGTFNFSAVISASGLADTNTANNSALASMDVLTPNLGQLDVSAVSEQTFNPQTGLMEQLVRVSNTSGAAVTNARVVLVGLTNRLYNAVGTNSGNPFVLYSGTLAPSATIDLRLELFVPTRLPDTNFTLIVYEAPGADLTAPPSAGPNISVFQRLGPDQMLIEFPAVLNRTYLILYSDNPAFTNALKAQPAIVAPGDRVQWVDDGPPKTISPPGSNTMRFYRVLQQ